MAGRVIDIVGNTYGYLTVISRAPDTFAPSGTKIINWLCLCECGREKIIAGTNLKNKKKGAKTCDKCPTIAVHQMVGKVFGRWTVISYHGHNNKLEFLWNVKCSCGNLGVVKTYTLKSGESKSCGCFHKERIIETGRLRMRTHHEVPEDEEGTVRPIAVKVRKMQEYAVWRKAVISRDGCSCAICHTTLPLKELYVHHIKFLSRIIREYGISNQSQARACPILWDQSNGLTLCSDCHTMAHSAEIVTIC